MSVTAPPVRVRIAPSPTGDPHVGTAYIALFNYVFARKSGGKFVLRIEDTDRTRSTPESETAILHALGWLGIQWDEGPDVGGPFGPYRQSERSAIYAEHGTKLLSAGRAYRCFCTPERLAKVREEQQAMKKTSGYDGHCRDVAPEESERRATAGETHVVRLRMPRTGETRFTDKLRGDVTISNEQIDDQVLIKSDGFPTYHLANVVDDHLMGITHVIRAEEWISSTPKHVVLYEAFGWQAPEWIHMPLLRNLDKSKISKRKNPVSIDYYRDAGILPETLRNFLGLMGWSLGGEREKFTLAEMVEGFTWDRISLGGPVFDLEKLAWLNGLYLREMSEEDFLSRLFAWRFSPDHLRRILPLVKDRIRRLDEFIERTAFFFTGDLDYAKVVGDLVPKGRTPKETAAVLLDLTEKVEEDREARKLTKAALDPFFRAFAEAAGWQTKDLFMTVRLAVTGLAATPPLFETMEVLGRELCRRRLRMCAEFLKKQK